MLFVIFCFITTGCEKLVEIDPPADSITNEVTFADSMNATSAVMGIYAITGTRSNPFGGGKITAYLGLYGDELEFAEIGGGEYMLFSGMLDSRNSLIPDLWDPLYQTIYRSNLCIEEINTAGSLPAKDKLHLDAECKFLRAFFYYYLINVYGEVPLITGSDFSKNISVPKAELSKLYDLILSDLQMAEQNLPDSYEFTKGVRVRANKYAAKALKARVLLELKRYSEAKVLADEIIAKDNLYGLAEDVREVFDKNGKEAILQIHMDPTRSPYNITGEGIQFIPFAGSAPTYFYRPALLSELNQEDLRVKYWIDSIEYEEIKYFFPRKYKLGGASSSPGDEPPQYYTLLRMSEIFLIRAECNINTDMVASGMDDINAIRNRAGLDPLTTDNQEEAMLFLEKERRVEFLSELGHRWFDLKRFGRADEVNFAIKPGWEPFRKVFPLPFTELSRNPALVQTNGY